MNKPYRLLKWVWGSLIVFLILGVLSDQVNTYLREGSFGFAPSTIQFLFSPTTLCLFLLGLAILSILTFVAWKSDRKDKQRSHFDLFKTTNRLTPEDMGFTVLPKGQAAQPGERPYYEGYVSRTYQLRRQSDRENGVPTTDHEVLKCIQRGDSVLLTGQPTEGKTRSAYELLKELEASTVVSINPNRIVSPEALSILKGKRVVVFVDDLSRYKGQSADLNRFYTETKKLAKQVVILATCRSGPELVQVTLPSSGLNPFYQRFSYELSLIPITENQKREILDESGLSLEENQVQNAPTPGWVVMNEARLTMEARFGSLNPDAKDALHALKLLRFAGVGPPTHQRVKHVLETIFLNHDIRLPIALKELAENAFIQLPATQDPVQPEEAYLRYVVSYVEGKCAEDDINALGQVLTDTADAEGLHYLAITLAMIPKRYGEALQYLKQATCLKEDFHEAWYSTGLVYYDDGNKLVELQQPLLASLAHEKAISAYKKALEINPAYYQAWNNLGIVYANFRNYEKAIDAYDKALDIKTNSHPHKVWYNKGSVRLDMDLPEQYEKAVKDFQQATEIKPDYHQAWDNLAYTFVLLERYNEALDAIQTARQHAPNDVKCWATYGIVLSYLNRKDAIMWLCKAWRVRKETHNADATEKQLHEAFIRLGKTPGVCI